MSDSPPPADPPPTDPPGTPDPPAAPGAPGIQGTRGGPTPNGDGLTRFFDGIRSLGVVRGDDRWFAGVLGGIAARTGLAPTALRIVVIVFGILGAPVLFAYVLAWALLPDLQGRIHAEQALRGVFEPVIVAIVILLIVAFPPFGGTALWRWPWTITGLPDWISTMLSVIWGIAIAIGIVWLLVYLVRQASGPVAGSGWAANPGPSTGASGWTAEPRDDTGAGPDAAVADVFDLTTPAEDPSGAPAQGSQAEQQLWSAEQRQWSAHQSAQRAAEQAAARQANRQASQQAAQQAREQQASERAAWYRDTRPGAAVTAMVLGLGLVVGALTAGIYSGGDFTTEAFVLGLAALLAVLALGVIVAGLLGRRSGGLGAFALLTILVLIPVAVFPFGSQVSLFGGPYWEVTSSDDDQGFAVFAGQPTVDLSDLEPAGSDPAVVEVWLGLGQTEVIVPRDEPVRIETSVLIGSIDFQGTTNGQDRGGLFLRDSRVIGPGNIDDENLPLIRVWTLIGQISITDDSR